MAELSELEQKLVKLANVREHVAVGLVASELSVEWDVVLAAFVRLQELGLMAYSGGGIWHLTSKGWALFSK